jgi:class 3 adenylate cyclase
MKHNTADSSGKVRVLSFDSPRQEKLFRLRNIRKTLVQSRFAYLLGLFLYCTFAILDLRIAPESFAISAIIRLVMAPIFVSIAMILTFRFKKHLEFWSVGVLLFTQIGHIALVSFGNFPPLYLPFVTSIVIIFSLTFSTLRLTHTLVFIAGTAATCLAVFVFVLGQSPNDLLFSCFILFSFTTIGILAGYSREYYIRQDFLQSDALKNEQKKTDELLLNILPRTVARELKISGTTLPVSYEGVTVLFADFVEFSKLTTGIDAVPVISTLDKYFSYFDFITRKYKLEKIKTIGDAYMLAGGLDSRIPTHAVDCILASFDFIDFIVRDAAEAGEHLSFDMRVGIHTGPVIAGVLGSLKFSYDIFGSTVNTASRMEKYSQRNRINISRNTYELVKDFFECENRGIVEVKNGEKYEMFFVTGLKKELCLDEEGNIPNAEFVRLYNALSEKYAMM